jgi:hypothetical protein
MVSFNPSRDSRAAELTIPPRWCYDGKPVVMMP